MRHATFSTSLAALAALAGPALLPARTAVANHAPVVAAANGNRNAAMGRLAVANNTIVGDKIILDYGTLKGQNHANEVVAWNPFRVAISTQIIGANQQLPTNNGIYNIALGHGSLGSNRIGSNNIAIGMDCQGTSTFASDNIAIGNNALSLNGSSTATTTPFSTSNIAIGNNALRCNAGDPATGGINNIAIGTDALTQNCTGNNNVSIGAESSPHPVADNNVEIGYSAATLQGANYETTAIGSCTTAATDSVAVGFGAYAYGTNSIAIGAKAFAFGDNVAVIGNTSTTLIGGPVGWSTLSDARLKTRIREAALGLDFIMSLKPVEYSMTGGNGKTDLGFLAQDIQSTLGEGYNLLGIGNDPDRTLTLRYGDLIAPIVKGIQEQQRALELERQAGAASAAALERALAAIQAELRVQRRANQALQDRLATLEAK